MKSFDEIQKTLDAAEVYLALLRSSPFVWEHEEKHIQISIQQLKGCREIINRAKHRESLPEEDYF